MCGRKIRATTSTDISSRFWNLPPAVPCLRPSRLQSRRDMVECAWERDSANIGYFRSLVRIQPTPGLGRRCSSAGRAAPCCFSSRFLCMASTHRARKARCIFMHSKLRARTNRRRRSRAQPLRTLAGEGRGGQGAKPASHATRTAPQGAPIALNSCHSVHFTALFLAAAD